MKKGEMFAVPVKPQPFVWRLLDAGYIDALGDVVEVQCPMCGHIPDWRQELTGAPACETCDPSGRRGQLPVPRSAPAGPS